MTFGQIFWGQTFIRSSDCDILFFQGEFPSVDDIGVAERALQDMRALIQLMQEEVAKFLEKKKEEEEQEQKSQKQAALQVEQEAKKAEEQLAQAKAQKKGAGIVCVQDFRC